MRAYGEWLGCGKKTVIATRVARARPDQTIGMVSTGVTSSRSGVSALMATTEAFSAVGLPVLVGTVAATPGRPLKQEWRFKLLMAAIDDGGGGICSKSNN